MPFSQVTKPKMKKKQSDDEKSGRMYWKKFLRPERQPLLWA
jgi:hypothetical protein